MTRSRINTPMVGETVRPKGIGEIGRSFVLQSSTDLAHWIPVGTNTLAGANAHFLLPGGAQTLFCRALLSH